MTKKAENSNTPLLPSLDIAGVSSSKPALAYEFHNYKTGHCYVEYYERKGMGESEGYTKVPLYKTSIKDRTETICIKFGRFLLKYGNPEFDKDALCWKYENKFYNTDELYKLFLEQL